MDITYFTNEGSAYAKGFFNQNGHSFYVLHGFEWLLHEKLAEYLAPNTPYVVESTASLPGTNVCQTLAL